MQQFRSGLAGMVVSVALMVKVQGEHPAMGLVQHMNDGRAVRIGERSRRAEKAERIGDRQQGNPPAS